MVVVQTATIAVFMVQAAVVITQMVITISLKDIGLNIANIVMGLENATAVTGWDIRQTYIQDTKTHVHHVMEMDAVSIAMDPGGNDNGFKYVNFSLIGETHCHFISRTNNVRVGQLPLL